MREPQPRVSHPTCGFLFPRVYVHTRSQTLVVQALEPRILSATNSTLVVRGLTFTCQELSEDLVTRGFWHRGLGRVETGVPPPGEAGLQPQPRPRLRRRLVGMWLHPPFSIYLPVRGLWRHCLRQCGHSSMCSGLGFLPRCPVLPEATLSGRACKCFPKVCTVGVCTWRHSVCASSERTCECRTASKGHKSHPR